MHQKKNFNYRSPDHTVGYNACNVDSGGGITHYNDWGVSHSYGRSSPGLDNFDNIYAHNVDSYGDISNYAKPNNTVTDSCGIK